MCAQVILLTVTSLPAKGASDQLRSAVVTYHVAILADHGRWHYGLDTQQPFQLGVTSPLQNVIVESNWYVLTEQFRTLRISCHLTDFLPLLQFQNFSNIPNFEVVWAFKQRAFCREVRGWIELW